MRSMQSDRGKEDVSHHGLAGAGEQERKEVIYQFRVEGQLLGYRASIKAAHDPRYKAFKQAVRLVANTAGVPSHCPKDVSIKVEVFWKKTARIDLSNVQKAVEDALWSQDRYIGHTEATRTEHYGSELADVTVITR